MNELERVKKEALLTRVRKEIAERLYIWDTGIGTISWQLAFCLTRATYLKRADQILSIPIGSHTLREIIQLIDEGKVVKMADDQSLPDLLGYVRTSEGMATQQDMLNKGAKFIEPLKPEGEEGR